MQSLSIKKNEAGQRFDKFIKKFLVNAPNSFIYKMIRKKNITINDKKALPEQILNIDDKISFYLSDETISKFKQNNLDISNEYVLAYEKYKNKIVVVYEDEDILLLNKPINLLSQKADIKDISINEIAIGYLLSNNQLNMEELATFKPSVCNRLDRNTSGLIIIGKSLQGLQELTSVIKDRSIRKFYKCLVIGNIKQANSIDGYLTKNEKNNKVAIIPANNKNMSNMDYIQTNYTPLVQYKDTTLLEVELITGKTHQIRAHLASIGHPIIGDMKYGNKKKNDSYKSQLLHAYKLEFPQMNKLNKLSNKIFSIEPEWINIISE